MLKLKLQYFGHLMWRTDSLEKILMLGKIEGRRRRGWERMRWLDLMDLITSPTQWTRVWASSRSWYTWKPVMLQPMKSQRVGYDWATELNWTEDYGSLDEKEARVCAKLLMLCPTLCDPIDSRMPGFPVHHKFLELALTHVHWVGHAIQSSHPLSSLSPPAFSLSQHQCFF